MLEIEIPKSKEKIIKYIKALKWQITQDTRQEDKEIHEQALRSLHKSIVRILKNSNKN